MIFDNIIHHGKNAYKGMKEMEHLLISCLKNKALHERLSIHEIFTLYR